VPASSPPPPRALPWPVAETGPLSGRVVEVEIGAAAHGGSCVARHDGRVIFVRHALPGERVRARVTEDRGGAYCRAEAVEILRAAEDRVTPPCPHAGPGRCGGCDWQHATGTAQRRLKAAVVREQFARLAAIDVAELLTEVEALPGGLLGWRTRIAYAVGPDARPGLYRHHSHEVEALDVCPLGVPGVGDAAVLAREWPGLTGIEVARGADGRSVLAHRPGPGRRGRGRRPPDRVDVVEGPARLRQRVGERDFTVAADGFWQVHPEAAPTFARAVLDGVRPAPGETVLDLYAGAGMLTAFLAEAVGTTGRVLGVESSRRAVADAAGNLADLPWAQVNCGRVDGLMLRRLGIAPDVVVLDPPRAGAGREVMAGLLALAPRVIGYAGCDPAALARDVRVALDGGWQLSALRAFDAFPMTHHVECVAILGLP
jgi:tRNA/tmRNA/rRNA uracil-C5-methylase (TrmA/RlmC/RlmD family)